MAQPTDATRRSRRADSRRLHPSLTPADRRLVEAYLNAGRPVDDLAYTSEFDQIIRDLGQPDTLAFRHETYKRLINLRKSGRLPSVGRFLVD